MIQANLTSISQQAAVARSVLAQLSDLLPHAGLHIDAGPTFLRAHYGAFSVIIAMRQAGEYGNMYLSVQRTPVTDRSTKRFFFRNGAYNLNGIQQAVVSMFTDWRDGAAIAAAQQTEQWIVARRFPLEPMKVYGPFKTEKAGYDYAIANGMNNDGAYDVLPVNKV